MNIPRTDPPEFITDEEAVARDLINDEQAAAILIPEFEHRFKYPETRKFNLLGQRYPRTKKYYSHGSYAEMFMIPREALNDVITEDDIKHSLEDKLTSLISIAEGYAVAIEKLEKDLKLKKDSLVENEMMQTRIEAKLAGRKKQKM